jgi:hypothetical protein
MRKPEEWECGAIKRIGMSEEFYVCSRPSDHLGLCQDNMGSWKKEELIPISKEIK